MSWMDEGEGPLWMQSLHAAEIKHGIPTNLLARIAFQESHFRSDIISGRVRSKVGAIGMMQLMPQFFPGAGVSVIADIDTAADLLASLYRRFQDWQTAVAAYNDGGGNVDKVLKGERQMPLETRNYVAQVFADVTVPGSPPGSEFA
jgi:soluble lytic murein transglycosylase-like protein